LRGNLPHVCRSRHSTSSPPLQSPPHSHCGHEWARLSSAACNSSAFTERPAWAS
jgi:hypothetical protein